MRYLLTFALSALLCGQACADGQTASLPNPQQRCAPRHGFIAANRRIRGWLLLGRSGGLPAREGRHLRHFPAMRAVRRTRQNTTRSAAAPPVTAEFVGRGVGVYDPSKISYGQLLKIYFAVAHDPTELNRQGPDSRHAIPLGNLHAGTPSRSVSPSPTSAPAGCFAHVYPQKIVTRVEPLPALSRRSPPPELRRLHPYNPYILINDRPKVEHLKEQFPALYRNSIM